MTKIFAILAFTIGISITTAPTALGDQDSYLQRIEPKMAHLTRAQILTEGQKVCRFIRSGHPSSDAVPMVIEDLAISVPAAVDLIIAAVVELGC
ncbi:hypothetical protein AU190_15930 [Mycolicibacterium acapulense]|uniref:DUF732 domain-containing protein n=1 Tax=Mycobacterium lehmannii TaxID=2048550 RepID=A0A101A1N9_9MYCO|nr:hypothetical protein [Mycobacterium lehmannii]KUI00816.1 hypothetical protein AU189_10770 [Mycolicibacterium acapulense]KUI03945.1 hypothetical protein AU190_15930 [Mycolicibacterium acapulense]KUI11217.1 hypothetical protein AU192_04055 [Mycobacterium lehmannii]KUI13531.1 hypothetical protein AU191_10305 [Mycolicibacterium acapulense]